MARPSRYSPEVQLRRLNQLKEPAYARPRYGHRRLTALLQREGWPVNHKRIHRIYREEELMVRTKGRKRRAAEVRVKLPPAIHVGECWSIDFMSDQLSDGRRFRVLTAVDHVGRECACLMAAQRIPSQAATDALDEAMDLFGQPEAITMDNGTEFACDHFDQWTYQTGLLSIAVPGSEVVHQGVVVPEHPYSLAICDRPSDRSRTPELFHLLEPRIRKDSPGPWSSFRGSGYPQGNSLSHLSGLAFV